MISLYTTIWEEHTQIHGQMFTNVNEMLAKCEYGKATVTYIGRQVGQGQVCPVEAKVSAIAEHPVPSTKTAFHRLVGMAGYYRNLCRRSRSPQTL